MESRLSKEFKSVVVMFQDKTYSIEVYYNEKTGNSGIAVVKGDYVDFPVIYYNQNNKVAFDRPEMLSSFIKDKVQDIAYNIDRP